MCKKPRLELRSEGFIIEDFRTFTMGLIERILLVLPNYPFAI
jgi:hypothetical protein